MKLLVSAYSCIPNRGSEPSHGWNWTIENAKLGHSVWCVTRPVGREEIETELRRRSVPDVSFIYVDVPRWLNYMYRFQPFMYLHYLVWQRKAAYEALRIDKEQGFDLVLHATLGSFQLGSGMWRLNKPLIFGPVGGGSFPPAAFRRYFFGQWWREVLRERASSLLLLLNRNIRNISKQASLVIVANDDTYAMARQAGALRIVSHPDVGLPVDFIPAVVPRHENGASLKLLWVGRILPRKGLPVVLEALSKVRSDIPFQLTIIGDGTHGHLVPGLIREYGLEGKVEWPGQLPWGETRQAYLAHDAFIFCSLRDTMGAQLMEAMAYALPIVTLNHQGAGDNVPDNAGIKVDVTTPEETTSGIALAVEYLFSHPDERKRMGTCGFEFSKTHTWESKARWLSRFYPELVGGRAGPGAS